jgi:hypothetical protein
MLAQTEEERGAKMERERDEEFNFKYTTQNSLMNIIF